MSSGLRGPRQSETPESPLVLAIVFGWPRRVPQHHQWVSETGGVLVYSMEPPADEARGPTPAIFRNVAPWLAPVTSQDW
jgi:hypothetical protein